MSKPNDGLTNNVDAVQKKMQELFGEKVANPEHQPKVFEYQVKLARWMVTQEESDGRVRGV